MNIYLSNTIISNLQFNDYEIATIDFDVLCRVHRGGNEGIYAYFNFRFGGVRRGRKAQQRYIKLFQNIIHDLPPVA